MFLRLIAGRVLQAAVTLVLISLLLFLALEVLPGDVATRVLGREATAEALEALRRTLRLDRPAPERYFLWLSGVLQGDLGTSLVSGRPVADILGPRVANTLFLSAYAFLLYLPLALVPAVVQAIRRGGWLDQALSVATLVLLAIPDFLLATLLLIGFAMTWPLFPSMSIVEPGTDFARMLRLTTLPALTLAIVMAVYALRMLRDQLIEVLQSEHIRAGELRGLPPGRLVWRHALPNALAPALNVTALNLAYLVGGVVVVEKVFSFPGFGTLLLDALQLRDLPVIEATVLMAAAIYIGANLLADLCAIALTPKLRDAR
jgi:peptide/nickel transport system permease protein